VAGTYTLTVTDLINGCTSAATTTVIQNTIPPADVSLQTSGVITCSNPSVLLQAGSSSTDVDYNWFGPDGYYAATAQATTEVPGDYMLMVTDRINGCSVMMNTTVDQDFSDCQISGLANKTSNAKSASMDAGNEIQLATYPNPVHGKGFITFKIPQAGQVTVKIYNTAGRN